MVGYISWCFLACSKLWHVKFFEVKVFDSCPVPWQSPVGADALTMITILAKGTAGEAVREGPGTVRLLSIHQTPITFPCLLVLSLDLTPAGGGTSSSLGGKVFVVTFQLVVVDFMFDFLFTLFLACECNPSGSYGNVCDPYNGQCPCRYGARGRQCNKCPAGYYNFPYCQCK